jgi:DNA-binding NarL/FixJ family response regulator
MLIIAMKRSVVVVEDDKGLREQIVAVLRTASDIRCLGAFTTAEEALAKIPTQNPDVILMDIALAGMSGSDCVARLERLDSAPQIIMLTVYEDTDRIFRALKAHANGYLLKSSPRKHYWTLYAISIWAALRCPAPLRARSLSTSM